MLLLLRCFSHVHLCATPETAAHQAPLSLGFSRQEYWSGLPLPSPKHAYNAYNFLNIYYLPKRTNKNKKLYHNYKGVILICLLKKHLSTFLKTYYLMIVMSYENTSLHVNEYNGYFIEKELLFQMLSLFLLNLDMLNIHINNTTHGTMKKK